MWPNMQSFSVLLSKIIVLYTHKIFFLSVNTGAAKKYSHDSFAGARRDLALECTLVL